MDGTELYQASLAQATAVVKQVRFDHFANGTPDAEWNVRDLLGHMIYELTWLPDILAGLTTDEVGTKYDIDLIGNDDIDLSENWQAAADRADLALADIDPDEIAHLSSGDVTIDDYLMQAASEQLIRAWDLGKSIGVPVKFDSQLASIIYEHSESSKQKLRETGLFAAEVEVVGDVDIQTRLLALFGRRADWHAA
jgi:uncharacterized protein (TIGR03086 family)